MQVCSPIRHLRQRSTGPALDDANGAFPSRLFNCAIYVLAPLVHILARRCSQIMEHNWCELRDFRHTNALIPHAILAVLCLHEQAEQVPFISPWSPNRQTINLSIGTKNRRLGKRAVQVDYAVVELASWAIFVDQAPLVAVAGWVRGLVFRYLLKSTLP